MPPPPKPPKKYPGYPKPGQRSGNPMHRGTYVPPPKPGVRGAGPAPLSANAWAQREAQRYIDAQIKAIQQSQQIYLDELNRQAQERVRQGQALAAWLQGQNFPGRVQDIYRTAGSDVAGYAQGFATDIRNIASADAAEVNNMLSGTGQEARNEGAGMGDVLYGAYGWSPARKFAETGAAFASDAALQPSFAARFAADDAMKLQQEGLGALKDFALQMAEARSGKYQVVQDLLARRQEAQDARFKRYMQLAALEMQRGNYARANAYLKLATQDNQLAARKQRIAELKAQGYAPDGKTPLPGYHIDPKTGRPAKDKTPKKKDQPKPADWGKIQGDMTKATKGFYDTVKDPNDIMGGTTRVKWTRQRAFDYLFAQFSGYVKDKARLRALINQVLDATGFPRPTGGK